MLASPVAGGTTGGASAGSSGAQDTAGMSAQATAGSVASAGMSGAGTGGVTAGSGGTGAAAGASGAGGAPPVSGACASTTDAQSGAQCADAVDGVYAVKTVVDVWWQDDAMPPLVDPGRDVITVYTMNSVSGVCPDGSGGTTTIRGCGTQLPPFKSDANCDVFLIEFPNAVWDAPSMPTFTAPGRVTGFAPGSVLMVATSTNLFGIELSDPNGTWPTPAETGSFSCAAGSGESCFPDHDGDGKPGITIEMGRIGETYSPDGCGFASSPFVYRGAPLATLSAVDDNSVRADRLQVGLRTRIGGRATLNASCGYDSGAASADFLDSRVFDCERTDGAACTPAEAAFVDESAPFYHVLAAGEAPPADIMTMGWRPMQLDQTPSAGPRTTMVRLGDVGASFGCGDVRSAAFPSL